MQTQVSTWNFQVNSEGRKGFISFSFQIETFDACLDQQAPDHSTVTFQRALQMECKTPLTGQQASKGPF